MRPRSPLTLTIVILGAIAVSRAQAPGELSASQISSGPGFLYVPNRSSSTVSAFKIDPATGGLASVPGSPFPTASSPISASVDPEGKFLYISDLSFFISAFRIDQNSGALTEVDGSPFPAGNNPQSLAVSPSGRFLYVLDTFDPPLDGEIEVFSIDSSTGAISETTTSPFSAGMLPASIDFTPNGKFAYVADIVSNTVLGYSVDTTTGALTNVNDSPFPVDMFPVSIAVEKTSRSVYAVTESDTVSGFHIDSVGSLHAITGSPFQSGGSVPLNIALDEKHLFAYVMNDVSATISGFQINPRTGALRMIGSPVGIPAGPVCAKVDPSSRFLYVVDVADEIRVFAINPASGALSEIQGSPFPTGGLESTAVAISSLPRR